MLKDFRQFIARGNVIDLAVGVVIGAAFGKIVDSLVKDVLMPPIGLILGKVDFSNLYVSLNGQESANLKAAQEAGAPTLNYGLFINNVISFVIVAFAIFLVIKWINRLRGPAPVTAPSEKPCPHCAMSIPLAAVRCPHCTSNVADATR